MGVNYFQILLIKCHILSLNMFKMVHYVIKNNEKPNIFCTDGQRVKSNVQLVYCVQCLFVTAAGHGK